MNADNRINYYMFIVVFGIWQQNDKPGRDAGNRPHERHKM